ncbi:MAG: hypothetical protein HN623_09615 [Bdellovibrionales bacterium]|nr:hypothetical protein [Bdellovibrionales bacterium]
MGRIGQQLPKALLPVFEKRLLDIQIEYAKRLKPKTIFINLHHHSGAIANHIEQNYNSSSPPIRLLFEDPILDSGGAIHNLKQELAPSSRCTLLTLNGDQCVFFKNPAILQNAYEHSSEYTSVLLPIWVQNSKEIKYNQIITNDNELQDIIKSDQVETEGPFMTYSGISFIRLDKLNHHTGASRFFDTVANYRQDIVRVEPIGKDDFEYWDFGTLANYYRSIYQLLNYYRHRQKTSSLLVELACDIGLLDESKIGTDATLCYNSFNGSICLNGLPITREQQVKNRIITIGDEKEENFNRGNGIAFESIFEQVYTI